ncbi:MAG: MFS transporter, partial [Promethearchaeota archaeon]
EPFWEGLKLTLKNKAFWIYMVPAFCIALILPVLQTGILYYIDYIIEDQDASFLLIALLLGVVLGFGINLLKIESFGPKRIMMINLSLVSLGFLLLFFLGWNASLAAIPGALIGMGLAGALISQTVVMGDIIDNDELITGKRREGIYGGVNAIVTKYPISIANWLFLTVIVAFGFTKPVVIDGIAYKQEQTELALIGIMIAFCIIPAIFLAISAFFMYWYPLDGPEWKKKKKALMKLHEIKEKEYIQKLVSDGKLNNKIKKKKEN